MLVNKILDRCELVGDCLLWQGATTWKGYGTITFESVQYATHRVICGHFNDNHLNLPFVLHSCDNSGCCNPFHLSWGTCSKNMMEDRDRNPRKLTRKDAWKIKYKEIGTHKEIGLKYYVNESTVTRIRSGIRWSDLTIGEFHE